MPDEIKKSDETKVEETDTTKTTTTIHDEAGQPAVHETERVVEPKPE